MTAPTSPLGSEPSSTVSGTVLGGRYRLHEVLGAGGMATVHDAVDERLERRVAVKVLRPETAARPDVRARFEAEARSAARLTHPNVVAVFDSGEDAGTPYLVMERLAGETLADRMQRSDLSVDWILRVAGDALGALGAAHAAGIIHRDVKPGNILIADDGCAKVGDFGIAKSLEVAAAADLTSTNQLLGTPAYVAPERISGMPATPRSDLYAVGIVLYEALSGRKPFTATTPVATAYAIQHTTPTPLGELRPDLAPDVVAAVERAMARRPEDRFESAGEMALALGVGISGGPAPAQMDATVQAAPATSTMVMPAVDAATLAALVADPADAAAIAEPMPAPLLENRRRLFLVTAAGLVVALVLFAVASASGSANDPGPADSRAPTTTQVPVAAAVPSTTVAPPTPPEPAAQPRSRPGKAKGHRDDD